MGSVIHPFNNLGGSLLKLAACCENIPAVNVLTVFYFSKVKAVNPVKMVNNGFQILTKNRTYTFVSFKMCCVQTKR